MLSCFGVNTMKNKYCKIERHKIKDWYNTFNMFARSLQNYNEIVGQFNSLSNTVRDKIKSRFEELEGLSVKRREVKSSIEWELYNLVNLHIIAGEYNIDPLTVIMCYKPICGRGQKLLIQ